MSGQLQEIVLSSSPPEEDSGPIWLAYDGPTNPKIEKLRQRAKKLHGEVRTAIVAREAASEEHTALRRTAEEQQAAAEALKSTDRGRYKELVKLFNQTVRDANGAKERLEQSIRDIEAGDNVLVDLGRAMQAAVEELDGDGQDDDGGEVQEIPPPANWTARAAGVLGTSAAGEGVVKRE